MPGSEERTSITSKSSAQSPFVMRMISGDLYVALKEAGESAAFTVDAYAMGTGSQQADARAVSLAPHCIAA